MIKISGIIRDEQWNIKRDIKKLHCKWIFEVEELKEMERILEISKPPKLIQEKSNKLSRTMISIKIATVKENKEVF